MLPLRPHFFLCVFVSFARAKCERFRSACSAPSGPRGKQKKNERTERKKNEERKRGRRTKIKSCEDGRHVGKVFETHCRVTQSLWDFRYFFFFLFCCLRFPPCLLFRDCRATTVAIRNWKKKKGKRARWLAHSLLSKDLVQKTGWTLFRRSSGSVA